MECNECKIVCNGKDVAVINCSEDGFNINCTDEGKNLCKQFFSEGKGCC